ncbi:MAG: General stress protein 69 [candidate division WS6 bacterium OLB20]|uniref:Protein tas n=1 Tax=candidate division WS6 bacterium OLB20 TaxID=1617426 RepID=A0A136LYJ3_9BACT|nr:MAG: General stress protein 69 [candidate division WS6 bacterium OLB20]
MEYSRLGTTDLNVSRICLGTMNWGEQNTEEDAHEQMDYAVEQGINFFDTAEIYPIPPNKESQGRTETYIGNWLKKTGKRDDLIIASKVTGRSDLTYVRDGETPCFNEAHIRRAIEGSLKRLQTDHIDLYQLHWPDRKTNYFGKRAYVHDPHDRPVEIAETLQVLAALQKEGKIRHFGVSNETAWGLHEFLRQHEQNDMPRVQSIQNPYSLIMREIETALAEIIIREQVSLLVYSPLSFGVLTGKYLDGVTPEGSRFHYTERNQARYNPAHVQDVIRQYVEVAEKHHLDPAELAIAFVNSREFVTSTIIGARTMEQLKTDIGAADITLPEDALAAIEAVHTVHPNPIT